MFKKLEERLNMLIRDIEDILKDTIELWEMKTIDIWHVTETCTQCNSPYENFKNMQNYTFILLGCNKSQDNGKTQYVEK